MGYQFNVDWNTQQLVVAYQRIYVLMLQSTELVGWIGAFFFAICAIPQAWKSLKDKHSDGLSLMFLVYWLLGEIFMTIYVWPTGDLPLLSNYFINLLLTSIIFYYKVMPNKKI